MMTDEPTMTTPPSRRRSRARWRGLAVGMLAVLSCLMLVLSTVAVWTHQVALNTDRYVAVVGEISSEPAVVEAVSRRVATQVVTALGVQDRLAQNLPPKVAFMADPLTTALTDRLSEGLATVLASPGFQRVWLEANRVAHATAVALLRGDTTVVTLENGVVTLNLVPLVGAALQQLQAGGLIPASVSLPDLSSGQLPPELAQQLQQALGVTIPSDLGQVPLFSAQRLASLQTAVRLFDLAVIVAVLLTVALIVLTVYLARRRLRMILALALGTIVAFAIARLIIAGIEGALVSAIASDDGATIVRGVLDNVLGNLYVVVRVVLLGAIVAALIAYLAGRPRWAVQLAAALAGIRRGGAGPEEGAAAAPTLGDWAREYQRGLLLAVAAIVGLAVIAAALGPELALLAAGALAIVALLVGAVDREPQAGPAKSASLAGGSTA